MVIQNFYMIVWYGLWLYVLLCLGVKLRADRRIRKRTMRRQEKIQAFFTGSGCLDEKKRRRILRYAKEDLLFDCICQSYIAARQQLAPGEKYSVEQDMQMLMQDKISALQPGDIQMRCLILRYLSEMGISSEKIEAFVSGCREGSELERILVENMDRKEHAGHAVYGVG